MVVERMLQVKCDYHFADGKNNLFETNCPYLHFFFETRLSTVC